jgi:hypothetical protein
LKLFYRHGTFLFFILLQIKNVAKLTLEDAKAVNKEIASTLEAVMSSHSHLQTVVEELQTELGKKDSTLKTLKNQKSTLFYRHGTFLFFILLQIKNVAKLTLITSDISLLFFFNDLSLSFCKNYSKL